MDLKIEADWNWKIGKKFQLGEISDFFCSQKIPPLHMIFPESSHAWEDAIIVFNLIIYLNLQFYL
jgi:hypothetical protein